MNEVNGKAGISQHGEEADRFVPARKPFADFNQHHAQESLLEKHQIDPSIGKRTLVVVTCVGKNESLRNHT